VPHLDALWHDVRLAVETPRHAPAVAATAVLARAVGVATPRCAPNDEAGYCG
jgi:hypothetical protein